MKQRLPLTLERFAALQARIDRGERLTDILASEALSIDAWRATQQGWLSLMSAEATHRRTRLAHRYQDAYFAERPDLVAAPADEPGDLDGTAVGVEIDLGASLPFVGKPAPPRDKPALANDALPFGRPRPVEAKPKPEVPPPASVDETILVGELRLDLDEALPFRGERPAPPPAAKDLTPPSAGDLDGTSTMNPALALEATLPFESQLTLEQYASLCAECEVNPEATARIEEKYGLAPGERSRLEASWRKRLARDAASSTRFRELLAQYTRWLKRRA